MKIYDRAVVTRFSILQKKICEISTPFLIDFISGEILLKCVIKNLVRRSFPVIWPLTPCYRMKSQFFVHVSMNCERTKKDVFSFQIYFNHSITNDAVMVVVYLADFLFYFLLGSEIGCLSLFPVIIVSIRVNAKPSQEPAKSKFILIFINKSICR